MLTGMRCSVGIRVSGIAILLRVVVLRHRTNFPARIVAGGCSNGHDFGLGNRFLLTDTGRRCVFRRSWDLFFRGTGSRVPCVTNPSERTLSSSSVRSIIVRARRFLPQVIKLDQFRLKIQKHSAINFLPYFPESDNLFVFVYVNVHYRVFVRQKILSDS